MRPTFRSAALVVVGALVAGSIGATAAPAQAAADDRSATWLTSQLSDGLVHNDQFDFDDYGLTADTAFALKAIGGQGAAVRDIRDALAPKVDSWTTGVDFGSSDVYAGSTAKAVVLAQTTGADPRSFGGVNLVKRLARLVGAASPIVGRIQDSAETDYANVIGQTFAARGLSVARAGKADDAVRFLLEQQCSSGYFRLNFAATDAVDQTCDGGDPATTSAPDTDVTALAVLGLSALLTKSAAVRSAISDAAGWLKHQQKTNGSFGGGPATEASNSNSTGLAGWALGETHACSAAAKAAKWVQRLQVVGDLSGTPLAGEKGAIAYDRAGFEAGSSDGIGTEARDQWRRATVQAAPSLLNLSVSACRAR